MQQNKKRKVALYIYSQSSVEPFKTAISTNSDILIIDIMNQLKKKSFIQSLDYTAEYNNQLVDRQISINQLDFNSKQIQLRFYEIPKEEKVAEYSVMVRKINQKPKFIVISVKGSTTLKEFQQLVVDEEGIKGRTIVLVNDSYSTIDDLRTLKSVGDKRESISIVEIQEKQMLVRQQAELLEQFKNQEYIFGNIQELREEARKRKEVIIRKMKIVYEQLKYYD